MVYYSSLMLPLVAVVYLFDRHLAIEDQLLSIARKAFSWLESNPKSDFFHETRLKLEVITSHSRLGLWTVLL
jgi:hypothetical protein